MNLSTDIEPTLAATLVEVLPRLSDEAKLAVLYHASPSFRAAVEAEVWKHRV